jgi:hypothetical protein
LFLFQGCEDEPIKYAISKVDPPEFKDHFSLADDTISFELSGKKLTPQKLVLTIAAEVMMKF